MNSEALLSTSSLRRACTLVIVLFVAILATNAEALPEPKVTVTYSLEALDGGAYYQIIADTPLNAGDASYVCDVADSMDPTVTVLVDNPLLVTMEFTADSPGGNIVDGPVELVDTHFEREFVINSGFTVVTTVLSTVLSRTGTGALSGSTITWDNEVGVNAYQETVIGEGNCEGSFCSLAGPWPRDLSGINDVILPTFTVFTDSTFGDSFASDNGTPLDRTDDIDRPDPDATVTDLWDGVEIVPEPSSEILLLAGALGLVGLSRLRERGGAFALVANLFASRR
jgi:hypothetical protein